MSEMKDVVIIGAGIVGMSCALNLQREGHVVTVVDCLKPGEGCSQVHAGLISPGTCVPMALPGILTKIPKWLFDPLGPLSLRWRYLPWAMPFLVRLLRNANMKSAEATSIALRNLHAGAFDLYEELFEGMDVSDLIRRTGHLCVYERKETMERNRRGWNLRERRGVKVEYLDKKDIQEMEPALAPIYNCAVFLPEHGITRNPLRMVQIMAQKFLAAGGKTLQQKIKGFEIGPDGPHSLYTDGGQIPAQQVVIAAGAWSGKLTKQLGDRIPLETERGYHLHLPAPGIALNRGMINGEHVFAVSPMETGVRLAGTVEFAGLKAAPNYRRARILFKHAQRMIPGIKDEGATECMGHRPSLPDSRPLIDYSSRFHSVTYAFGHSHFGASGSPMTGKLIADLVAQRHPQIDISPFRLNRF